MDHDYLNSITYEQTQPFIPQVSYCKVIKVYDGDTVTVASRTAGTNTVYRFSVRLAGIDSPEMNSKNNVEKERAIFVRDRLHDLVFGKIVLLKNLSTEKYGRILADIYLDSLHVNQYMIDQKYACVYSGGKKQVFVEKTN
jgi:endonuclease YncB( thermonuclease family)